MAAFQRIQTRSACSPARRGHSEAIQLNRPWPGAVRFACIIGASAAGWLLSGLGASRIL